MFQVLAVYLGASWVLLQVIGELREALDLPRWIGPVSLILLVLGLLMVVATAWVQAHPPAAPTESASPTPGSWELALGGVRASLARGEVPHLTWARAALGGVFAFSLLFGLAGLYVVIRDRGQSFQPPPALAENAAPGIAVLPFTVSDPALEEWREGMVNVLSTNLDGAGGLRAIDSRTVLARWDEHAGGDARSDLAGSLEVARAAGARHALLGNVIAGGGGLRINAEVYQVDSQTPLDRVTVEGPVDSIFALVDRLSVRVLEAVLPDMEGEFAGVGLARVTTGSLPALRAFLEGESLFRRGRFGEAIPAYERAVAADSTFALASYRLSNCYGWAESIQSELSGEAIERAWRHADRLPERERILVGAERALFLGTLDGLDALRLAVRRYPDDPEAWYLLGDTYMHLGSQALVPTGEVEAALARSVELDPDFTPAHIHLADMAFRYDADSARARARIDRYRELAGGTTHHQGLELAFALAFGDSATRALAREGLDTTTASLTNLGATNLLGPRFVDALGDVSRELRRRGHRRAPIFDAYTDYLHGRVRAASGRLADSGYPAEEALADGNLLLQVLGYLRSETALAGRIPGLAELDPAAVGRLDDFATAAVSDTANPISTLAAGMWAAGRGRDRERAAATATLRAAVDRLEREGDEYGSRFAAGGADALDGFGAWRRGDRAAARGLLEDARTRATASSYPGSVLNDVIRWWEAGLAQEEGRTDEAETFLRSLADIYPVANLRLGRLLDERGARAEAIEAYRLFITAWYDPEPEFLPLVEDVGQRIAILMDTGDGD